MWGDYCEKMLHDKNKITGEHALIFMRFLARNCNYSKSSLKRVIGPNLKRKSEDNIGSEML